MSTRTIIRLGLGLSLSLTAMVSGCYIENDSGPYDKDQYDSEEIPGVCYSFCDELVSCGTIVEDAASACVEQCQTQHASTPYMVEQGATCVLEQGCKKAAAYDCPGAPFPTSDASDSDSDSDSNSDNNDNDNNNDNGEPNPGDQPASCNADCDCPSGDSCVEGSCKTPCNASCDCAEGESCEAGFCEPPPEPSISCEVDCDCPSGQTCVEGTCA